MKLSLALNPAQVRKNKKRIKPVDHFKKCPKCGDVELIHVDPDVVCSKCDWDSCLWDVQRGAMNDLEVAAREFFAVKTEPKIKSKKCENILEPTELCNSEEQFEKEGA